jgi:hypothetical protein
MSDVIGKYQILRKPLASCKWFLRYSFVHWIRTIICFILQSNPPSSKRMDDTVHLGWQCRRRVRIFFPPKTTAIPTCRRHVADTTQTMLATWHRVGSSDAVSVSCRHDDLPTCRRRVVDHGRRPPRPLPPPMPLQRPIHRFGPAGYIIRDVVCARFAQNRAGSLLFHWFENKGN